MTTEALRLLAEQTKTDLSAAHAEICKLQGLDPATNTWPEWSSPAHTIAWCNRILAGATDAVVIVDPEALSDARVAEAMLDAWNEICSDTGNHPLDIEHGRGTHLTFEPKHWARATAMMLRHLCRQDYFRLAARARDQKGEGE